MLIYTIQVPYSSAKLAMPEAVMTIVVAASMAANAKTSVAVTTVSARDG